MERGETYMIIQHVPGQTQESSTYVMQVASTVATFKRNGSTSGKLEISD